MPARQSVYVYDTAIQGLEPKIYEQSTGEYPAGKFFMTA